jgi:hypothetical protein
VVLLDFEFDGEAKDAVLSIEFHLVHELGMEVIFDEEDTFTNVDGIL